MKISSGFILREIADEFIVVPVEDKFDAQRRILRLNETSKFLWELLQNDTSKEQMVIALFNQYEVDYTVACQDVDALIQQLNNLGCLEN